MNRSQIIDDRKNARLDNALADASCEAHRLEIFAESIADSFFARYNTTGCSIEQAAAVNCPWATPATLSVARAKIVAEIENGWGREAANRWDSALRSIWGCGL